MPRFDICLISQQFGEVKSGIGVYTRNVARRLLEDGHTVTLVCPRERVSRDLPGIDLVGVSGKKTGSSHIRWLVLSWRFGRAVRELLHHRRFHMIHFTDAREALFCPDSGIPLVGNMNDYYFAATPISPWEFRSDYVDWPVRWTYYRIVRLLERRALGKLAAIICNSRHTREVLKRAYRIEEQRLPVIYKSIDLNQYHFRSGPAQGRGRCVLFIGGNVQRKGLPTVIRAAPIVLERFPGTVFSVVGDNQNLGAMKRLCSRFGVRERFQFWGWQSQDQIQDHYRRATVFAMPSLIEAFGVVFLEAMASGVPVIGGDTGGTRELIQDGINGFLIAPRDHRDLAKKILCLFEDEKTRRRMIDNGRQTVGRYTVETMVQATYDLYQRLLS
jgi:glycosyltransferase involved in cell wall biosynthesis